MTESPAAPPDDPEDDLDLSALEEPVGAAAAAAAARTFAEEFELPLPPVPREFLEAMRVLEPGLFGTVTDAPWPWDLPAWLEGVRAGTIGDGVVFGHAGHGVNSWAMHYYLVHGPLALLVQLLWGGAYTDHAAAAARIGLAFEACARLILADGLQRLPPRPRLVVVESDLHGRQVGWLDEHGQGTLGPHPNPLAQALALLEPLRRPQRSAKNASASSSSSSSNS